MKKYLGAAVLCVLAAVAASPARVDAQSGTDDVRAGRALALKVCTACHVVSRDQEMPPILRPPAPSFESIANRRGMTEEGARHFLATTHSTMESLNSMPNPKLTDDQNRQVAAFLMSLKKSR